MSSTVADRLGFPAYGERQPETESAKQRLQRDANENLAHHFLSVQSISDATTLPQMLEELERHLNRAASVDALILKLR